MTIQPLSTEPVEDTPAIFGLDEMADAEDLSSTGVDGAPSAEACLLYTSPSPRD